MKKYIGIFGILLIVVVMAGCDMGPNTITTTTTTLAPRIIGGSLEVSVYTDKGEYAPAENITLYLKFHNIGTATMEFNFADGQKYDYFVSKNGTEVWKWSHGKSFIQMLTSFLLVPGSTEVFSVVWDQKDNNDVAAGSGDYSVLGCLVGSSTEVYGIAGLTIR